VCASGGGGGLGGEMNQALYAHMNNKRKMKKKNKIKIKMKILNRKQIKQMFQILYQVCVYRIATHKKGYFM
jgi:hypothetical protein